MDAETKLAALWAEATPPARDGAFVLAVIERMERKRVWRGVFFELMPMVVAFAACGRALAPAITDLVTAGVANAGDAGTPGLAVALSVILGAWLAFGGLRARPA
jgi:hypothetical protein